jgi:N-acyl-D-amino-acid deacylase
MQTRGARPQRFVLILLPLLMTGGAAPAARPGVPTYDLILHGGTIIDGTGSAAYRGDVAVLGDRIAEIGDLGRARARRSVDVSGLVVAPGFINVHDHSEPESLTTADNMLSQGVTTAILNPDGGGDIDIRRQLDADAVHGLIINVGAYIGFNSIWKSVVGDTDRRPTPSQIQTMRGIVKRNLAAGAWGVSAGLDYQPAYFARTNEVIAVVSAASTWRTNFPNHERLTPESGWSSRVGIRETIAIASAANLSPVITHIKAQGRDQGTAAEIIAAMRDATQHGHYAAADVYPYLAGQNVVGPLIIPAWAISGGRPELLKRLKDPALRAKIAAEAQQAMDARFGGASGVYILSEHRELVDIAKEWNVPPAEAFLRLAEKSLGATILRFGIEQDLIEFLRNSTTAIACDCGAILPSNQVHPRYYGTFPRVLGHYVRETHVLSLEDAVRRMTGLPASMIGLVDRGLIAPGMAADLTIFDASSIADHATYDEPSLPSTGISRVFVNGQQVFPRAAGTPPLPGRRIFRSEHMPTRPTSNEFSRRASAAGVAVDPSTHRSIRFNLDVFQACGSHLARGALSLVGGGHDGRVAAGELGNLQLFGRWASLTAMTNRSYATLIVDPERPGGHIRVIISDRWGTTEARLPDAKVSVQNTRC